MPTALPAIVKPVDNCSSRGVRWIDGAADLSAAVADALEASQRGEALIEQFLVGTEGSIEALVQDGRARHPRHLRQDEVATAGPLRSRASLSRSVSRRCRAADRGAGPADRRWIRASSTAFSTSSFSSPIDTGRCSLIEFAIRGCGSKVATHLMPALTGVDVVRA